MSTATEKGNFPKVTVESIESKIKGCEYICPAGGTMTICVLTLENGFQVTGVSACVSIQNFDSDLGLEISRKQAFDKVWALEGYLLKQREFERQIPWEIQPPKRPLAKDTFPA